MNDHLVFTSAHEDSPSLEFLNRVDVDEFITHMNVLCSLSSNAVDFYKLTSLLFSDNGQEDDLL
jgi:hypothetical protein